MVARTDARTSFGVDEAIRRANLYLKAGAEMVFIESPENYDEVKKIAAQVDGPVLFNNVEGGRSPFLSREELKAAGIKAAIYPNAQTRIVTCQCSQMLSALMETGTTASMQDRMLSHKDMFAMYHHDEWVALEKKYIVT